MNYIMNEERIKMLEQKINDLEFRQQLLFDNDEVSRLLFEYKITQSQYRSIMDLMDKYRETIGKREEVHHSIFEDEIYAIVPEHKSNYHMCEYLTRAFMDCGRWEEVFPALYGNMLKYKYLMESRDV